MSTHPAHIVALSGGKDSTALALRLAEVEPREYTYICTPTGDELPAMESHWSSLERLLGAPIQRVQAKLDLSGLIADWNALPNFRQRWCTRVLKIQPFQAALARLAAEHGGDVTAYVGLRADEPERDGALYPAAHGGRLRGSLPDVKQRFPLREWGWGVEDVWEYLGQRGVAIPPRTDCARCFWQTLHEWYTLWREHPAVFAEAEAQEAMTGHTFRSPQRDTWPAALAGLRSEFESGRVPTQRKRAGDCRVCSL